jgi:hypothetical protein
MTPGQLRAKLIVDRLSWIRRMNAQALAMGS